MQSIFWMQILGLEDDIDKLKIIHIAGTKGKVPYLFPIRRASVVILIDLSYFPMLNCNLAAI